MNEPPTAMLGASAAFRLGAALLAGLALMLALAARDHHRRAELETVEEATAVGDKALVTLPASVRWQGRPLRIEEGKRESLRDTRMRRVGRDEASGVSIYQYQPPPGKAPPPLALYLKAGPNEYLRAHVESSGRGQ
jgi:hypothetical protein